VKKRVLIIEDEPSMLMSLSDRLVNAGYEVDGASDGVSGYERITKRVHDIVILDGRLPRKDGFDVCRAAREDRNPVPILMLTARGGLTDRVQGLMLGADDYLAKPFEPAELLARLVALLRRATPAAPASAECSMYRFGEVQVDVAGEHIVRDHRIVRLPPREFKLLHHFLRNQGRTLSRDELLNHVWGYESMPTTRTVDVHVGWIRQKIEPDPRQPRHLLTVHRRGYKFVG
jgi:DNA-binding response OmpR family regulator